MADTLEAVFTEVARTSRAAALEVVDFRGGRGGIGPGIAAGLVAGAVIGGAYNGGYGYGPGYYDDSYAYDNGYNGGYDNGYAVRNGFVCQPGTWFRGEDGRRHLCQ